MSNGPSKQDLETYFKTSRAYFDELAKYYQTSDPEYYREYIKPFYDNPFNAAYSSGSGKSNGCAGKSVIGVAVLLLVLGFAAAAIFYFMDRSDSVQETFRELSGEKKVQEKNTSKENNGDYEIITNEDSTAKDDPSELSGEDNFILGAKYIGEKKYDKAEYHLKKIKKNHARYNEAQQLLKSIKFLKKYDK